MSHLHSLETRLRSWTPRPPSASLKAKLFSAAPEATPGGEAEPTTVLALRPWRPQAAAWSLLAPVMAVFFVGLFVADRGTVGLVSGTSPHLLAAAVFMEPQYAAYLGESYHTGLNRWGASTFEWTNGQHSQTTSPLNLQTNRTIQ